MLLYESLDIFASRLIRYLPLAIDMFSLNQENKEKKGYT